MTADEKGMRALICQWRHECDRVRNDADALCELVADITGFLEDDVEPALERLAHWPRKSENADGVFSRDGWEGLANVRCFARAALAQRGRENE